MQSKSYRPSLSTGIYGSYTIQHKNDGAINMSHDTKKMVKVIDMDDYKMDEQHKADLRQKFFADNNDVDIPIEPIYNAAKQMDDRVKLIFKPECNYKGCCNKPEISADLLKGDMYICKKHRIEMAKKLKQSNNPHLKSFILKLQTYDDDHFYAEGKKLENNDYFLQNYAKSQQEQLQTAKKLLTIKDKMSSEYWHHMFRYKQLHQQSKLLVSIRKVSNPFLAICAVVVLLARAAAYGKFTDVDWSAYGKFADDEEEIAARKQREEEKQKKIEECAAALEDLKEKFLENDELKKKCIKELKDVNGKIEQIEADYQKELKPIQDALDEATTNLKEIDDTIKAQKEEMNNNSKGASFADLFKMQQAIQKLEEDKVEQETAKQKHENELQKKKEEFAKSEAAKKKQALEIEKRNIERELKKKEQREDELNWDRAKTRAEYLCRNTSSGRVAVYVVYDDRYSFSSGYHGYNVYRDETYDSYGHWKICKMDARWKKHDENEFRFTTRGRYSYRYHYIDGRYNCYKNGDEQVIKL